VIAGREVRRETIEGSFLIFLHERKGKGRKMMDTKNKGIIGYYTADGDIYCVECIKKNIEMMKEIDKAITTEDMETNLLFCEGCEKEMK
jgi:hypothetical protein